MFKFDHIETNHQGEAKKALINRLIKSLKATQGSHHLPKRSHMNFIILDPTQGPIVGGACLIKKKIEKIHADILELVCILSPQGNNTWECSYILQEPHAEEIDITDHEYEKWLQQFYYALFESFVEFGKLQSINYLIMRLTKEAYLHSKEIGNWPYVVELKPRDSADNLFHGVLPLSGKQCDAYLKKLGRVDS